MLVAEFDERSCSGRIRNDDNAREAMAAIAKTFRSKLGFGAPPSQLWLKVSLSKLLYQVLQEDVNGRRCVETWLEMVYITI